METIFRTDDGRVEIYQRPDGTYGVITRTATNELGECQATIGYLTFEQLVRLTTAVVREVSAELKYREETPS